MYLFYKDIFAIQLEYRASFYFVGFHVFIDSEFLIIRFFVSHSIIASKLPATTLCFIPAIR